MKTETVPVMLAAAIKTKKSKVTETEPTPADFKEPTPAQRAIRNAHDSKVRATADWVDGHITNSKHDQIHKRANAVIKAKGCVK
jgi:hypothetical protein